VHDPANSSFPGRLNQDFGICNGLIEGRLTVIETHPVGIEQSRGSSHGPDQACRIAKIHRRNFDLTFEWTRAIRMVRECPDLATGGQKPPGDVLSGVAEGAGDDIEVACFDHDDVLSFLVSPGHSLRVALLRIRLACNLNGGAPGNVPAQNHAHDHHGND
jgi:hypothetical protein